MGRPNFRGQNPIHRVIHFLGVLDYMVVQSTTPSHVWLMKSQKNDAAKAITDEAVGVGTEVHIYM